MLVLFTTVLWFRQQGLLAEEQESLSKNLRYTPADIAKSLAELRAQGVGWNLLAATWAIFQEASVVVAMTVLVSTFASSSLFTIIVASATFLIGHFHKVTFKAFSEDTGNPIVEVIGKLIVWIIPDFRTYNIVDAVAAGVQYPSGIIAGMGVLTLFYLAMYLLISLYLFFDQEF